MASISDFKQSGDELTMIIKNTDVSLVNAIRRTILSDCETVAFNTDDYINSDLKIITNTTPLHNEYILHRFGLIPINIKNVDEFESGQYKFVLNKQNTGSSIINVTTADFEVYNAVSNEKLNTNDFFPADKITGEYILLLKLKPNPNNNEGEHIHIEGKASKSTGKKNSRFSPVSCVVHTYVFDEDKFKEAAKDQEDIKRFKIENGERFYKTDENDEPNEFNFTIESIGVLEPKQIMKMALNVLTKKMLRFQEGVSKIIENNATVEGLSVDESIDNMQSYEIEIENESHTIGNLLQAYLAKNPDVEFVGYKNPHPLIEKILIKIKVSDHELGTVNRVFRDTTDGLVETFNKFIEQL
jgi:DNA-directed RNA polymerase subunit L